MGNPLEDKLSILIALGNDTRNLALRVSTLAEMLVEENDTLRAENERLRGILRPIVAMLDKVSPDAIGDLWPGSLMQAGARAALEDQCSNSQS
jgi:hypothetical protein